ncbi:uncharacterized protein LOC130450083 isoform X1 [Diorhabda sublineata]|uniref:uncharacterized protein LOC130450083 isoform X1 n=1 Tax=Diorhabda sublineata TaxID=1163346 RepID=UPI0024E0F81A|nr:uncharacterized protein LOC130450083 isoform X1 [Diorhabda sublineata]
MSVPKIEKLNELLISYLGNGKAILDTKINRLTAPGENFGSEILEVEVIIKEEVKKVEKLNVVVKLIPESEFARTVIMNAAVSFKIEKGFYDSVIPTLQAFQRNEGLETVIDCFPQFYCARNNLRNECDIVDADAVLILENLKVKVCFFFNSGYKNVCRNAGFDLPTAKLILKYLAQFHAVPIALKRKDPKSFENNIKAYTLVSFPPPPRPPIDQFMQLIYMIMRESHKCKYLVPKMRKSASKYRTPRTNLREPFTTLSHQDFWINNIMVKFDCDNRPVDCKFLDFQICNYDSPAADLFFFLFTSVRMDVLKNNLNNLIKYYLFQFQKTLESLNCDLKFTYENLLEEISSITEWELAHTIFMYAMIINSPKGGYPLPNDKNKDLQLTEIPIPDTTKERIWWICEECEKRGWLHF